MVVLSKILEGPSSSSSIVRPTYDVFLSFRGCDTRDTFIDHLHKALMDADITTFLDDEMIQTEDDLKPEVESVIKTGKYLKLEPESVIKESRASIIVLSKNYANSPRRLDELVLILEQRMASNYIVIPIFYHVEPAHVWKQQSTFGLAMAEHKQRMEAETDPNKRSELAQKIDQWNKALTEVANLKGRDVNGRRETEFIEEIVKDIYRRIHVPLRSALPLLIGMESSIKFVTSWLNDASSHTAEVLTIVGMGGIGKTSLAKYVYGLHSHEFETRSFIEDISRRCDEKFNGSRFIEDVSLRCESFTGLFGLQKQLYDDISESSSIQVPDASVYTIMIEDAVAHKKMFLVLDDIDSLDQLDALLGSKGFHPGSKLIITTKDMRLTKTCALFQKNVKPKHDQLLLNGLDDTESWKLLCLHAFMCNDPKAGYEEVSEELVKYCGGHPLALEILGKSLHNRDVVYWKEYIAELKKEIDSRIYSALRKSFDSLPSENDKDLFKHIACFFVGMDRGVTETILNACGINTKSGFTNLIGKCLLSIGSNNELKMHQLLQQMGRFIVTQESPDKPWERSRLLCLEALKVIKHRKGTEKVLGLSLDMSMVEKEKFGETLELKSDVFSKMDKLMLLKLNYVQINEFYVNLPEELRWLCMHGFPLKSIPSYLSLSMENLVSLDLSYSNIESFDISYTNRTLPQEMQEHLLGLRSKDKMLLGSLKILILSFCVQLRSVGGFDGLPALERLIATDCIHLVEVCESLEQCVELVHVDLSYCNNLEKGPTIGKLEKVKTLLLDGCNLGESRTEIRIMDLLEMLKPDNIGINTKPSSSTIPEAIPRDLKLFETSLPKSLVSLSLVNNDLSTESFPMDFSCLSMLKELYLDDNPIVSLPICVRTLPRLEYLSLIECTMLPLVVHTPHKLTDWSVSLNSTDNMLLEDVYDLSPLVLSLYSHDIETASFEIEGMVKIQPMASVEEKILRRLGWSNILSRGSEESKIQMYYEFGIFSTFYVGREMPNWITDRCKGPSISFTIPSSPNNLIGLNFCYVLTFRSRDVRTFGLPMIVISNTRRNGTWIYKHYIKDVTLVGDCLILLSHWIFGFNEMESGDYVTITGTGPLGSEAANQFAEQCGVSFVYDYGKREEEEDVLGYYKSWNHIIGGDLSPFRITTGKYLLDTRGNMEDDTEVSPNLRELVGEDKFHKEEQVRFEALFQRKSRVSGNAPEEEEEDDDGQMCPDAGKGRKRMTMMMRRKRKTMMMIRRRRIPKSHQSRTLSLLGADSLSPRIGTISEGPSNVVKNLEEAADSLSLGVGTISEGPSNVAKNLEEGADSLSLRVGPSNVAKNFGASTQHVDTSSGLSTITYIPDQTRNPSSWPPLQSSQPDGFSIPKSKKKRIQKTGEDASQELDQPLFAEDDRNLGSRHLPRRRLMDVESSGSRVSRPNALLVTTSEVSFLEDASIGNVDNAIPPGTKTTFADLSHADFSRLYRIKAADDAAFMAEAVNRYDSLVATELECVRLRNELAKHKTVVVEQMQHMDLVVQDHVVQMQDMEAEHYGLVDRFSQAEVARKKAESKLKKSEALREDANKKMLSLEASNSELANRVELLESEKKRLVERVAVLEAADAKRVGS